MFGRWMLISILHACHQPDSVHGSHVRIFSVAQGRGCLSDLGDCGNLKHELTEISDLFFLELWQ